MPDPAGEGDRSRDAAQVRAIRGGDQAAFGGLFDRWFDRVYDVARNVLHDDHAAADVAQDTFLAAWQQLDRLADPASFGGWVLRISRNRALDRLRQAQRTRPMDDEAMSAAHDAGGSSPGAAAGPIDPADVTAAVERDDLVRVAVLALGSRDASLVDLHMRHGLTPAEIAAEIGVTPNAAYQQLFRMRERLGNAVGSLLLWRRGRPTCARLATALGGAVTFDATALDVIDRHGRDCTVCSVERAAMTAPDQLFAAVPIAVAPIATRADVIGRLAEQGVPLSPHGGGAVTPDGGGGGGATVAEPVTRRPVGRAVRRLATRRGAVLTTSVGVVATVTVGLVLVARDGDEPISAPSATSQVVTTVEPATTRPSTARATTTTQATTTTRPATTTTVVPIARAGSTTVAQTTAGALAPVTTTQLTTTTVDPVATCTTGPASTTTVAATTTRPATTTTVAPTTVGALAPVTTTRPATTTTVAPTTTTTTVAPTTTPPPTTTTVAPTTTRPATTTTVAPTVLPGCTTVAPTTTSAVPTTEVPDSTGASPTAATPTVGPTAPPVTAPPTLPPATVAPTPPPTPPPTVAVATTTSTTTPPAPTTVPAPPVVTGFTVAAGSNSLICAGPGQSPRRFQWTSVRATSATLTIAGTPRSVPLSGPYDACASSGDSATIAVSGPGGDDSRSLVAP